MSRAPRVRTLLGLAAASVAVVALAACSSGAPASSEAADDNEYGLVKAGTWGTSRRTGRRTRTGCR